MFDDSPPYDAPWRRRTAVVLLAVLAVPVFAFLAVLLAPTIGVERGPTRSSTCKYNLKQIALALHNYHEDYGSLPPAFTVDDNGQPLHSWRTLLLPYLDQTPLYRTIDFSKPWDHPANAAAFKTTIPVYQCPSAGFLAPQTTYLANAAPQGCFRPSKSIAFSNIKDGLEGTVMVIEVAPTLAIHWMSPHDAGEALIMSLDAKKRVAHPHGAHVLFCDGSVRALPANLPDSERRAQISIAAGDR